MSKYNWHMKYDDTLRYWVILNSEAYKDVGIIETSYLIKGTEKREYILYDGHITLGHYDTLRAAKQAFALRVTIGGNVILSIGEALLIILKRRVSRK